MLRPLKINNERDRGLLGIIICVLLLIVGYVVLNFISTREKLPLGHTIYILIGTLFMAVGGVGIIIMLKYLYDLKKRERRKEIKRRKHKIVFLKKESLRKESK